MEHVKAIHAELTNLREENAKLRKNNKKLCKTIAEYRSDAEGLQWANETLTTTNAELAEQKDGRNEEIKALRAENDGQRAELQQLRQTHTQAAEERAYLREENEELRTDIFELCAAGEQAIRRDNALLRDLQSMLKREADELGAEEQRAAKRRRILRRVDAGIPMHQLVAIERREEEDAAAAIAATAALAATENATAPAAAEHAAAPAVIADNVAAAEHTTPPARAGSEDGGAPVYKGNGLISPEGKVAPGPEVSSEPEATPEPELTAEPEASSEAESTSGPNVAVTPTDQGLILTIGAVDHAETQHNDTVSPRDDDVPVCETDIVDFPHSTASVTQDVPTEEVETTLQQTLPSSVTDSGLEQAPTADVSDTSMLQTLSTDKTPARIPLTIKMGDGIIHENGDLTTSGKELLDNIKFQVSDDCVTAERKFGDSWREKISSEDKCMRTAIDREPCEWTTKHEKQFACRSCYDKRKACVKHVGENDFVVLPLPPLVRKTLGGPGQHFFYIRGSPSDHSSTLGKYGPWQEERMTSRGGTGAAPLLLTA